MRSITELGYERGAMQGLYSPPSLSLTLRTGVSERNIQSRKYGHELAEKFFTDTQVDNLYRYLCVAPLKNILFSVMMILVVLIDFSTVPQQQAG